MRMKGERRKRGEGKETERTEKWKAREKRGEGEGKEGERRRGGGR